MWVHLDYQRQGILYLARSLPPPGRDGLSKSYLDEIAELVPLADAPLGLFSHVGPPPPPPMSANKLPKLTIPARATPSCPNSPDGSLRTRS